MSRNDRPHLKQFKIGFKWLNLRANDQTLLKVLDKARNLVQRNIKRNTFENQPYTAQHTLGNRVARSFSQMTRK